MAHICQKLTFGLIRSFSTPQCLAQLFGSFFDYLLKLIAGALQRLIDLVQFQALLFKQRFGLFTGLSFSLSPSGYTFQVGQRSRFHGAFRKKNGALGRLGHRDRDGLGKVLGARFDQSVCEVFKRST